MACWNIYLRGELYKELYNIDVVREELKGLDLDKVTLTCDGQEVKRGTGLWWALTCNNNFPQLPGPIPKSKKRRVSR